MGCIAIVMGRPNISHFTQVKDMGNDTYQVRLGVADYENQAILKTQDEDTPSEFWEGYFLD